MSNDDPDSVPPLTDAELRKLRELLKADERAVWLWGAIKVWATWIAAVVVAVTMGWESLRKIVNALKS